VGKLSQMRENFRAEGWAERHPSQWFVKSTVALGREVTGVGEFAPEAYGLTFAAPRPSNWRWLAAAVGLIGIAVGFWRLRRRRRVEAS
jgi:hypothetical protein